MFNVWKEEKSDTMATSYVFLFSIRLCSSVKLGLLHYFNTWKIHSLHFPPQIYFITYILIWFCSSYRHYLSFLFLSSLNQNHISCSAIYPFLLLHWLLAHSSSCFCFFDWVFIFSHIDHSNSFVIGLSACLP